MLAVVGSALWLLPVFSYDKSDHPREDIPVTPDALGFDEYDQFLGGTLRARPWHYRAILMPDVCNGSQQTLHLVD